MCTQFLVYITLRYWFLTLSQGEIPLQHERKTKMEQRKLVQRLTRCRRDYCRHASRSCYSLASQDTCLTAVLLCFSLRLPTVLASRAHGLRPKPLPFPFSRCSSPLSSKVFPALFLLRRLKTLYLRPVSVSVVESYQSWLDTVDNNIVLHHCVGVSVNTVHCPFALIAIFEL